MTKSTVTTQRTAPADGNNAPIVHVTELQYDNNLRIASEAPLPLAKKIVEPGRGLPSNFIRRTRTISGAT